VDDRQARVARLEQRDDLRREQGERGEEGAEPRADGVGVRDRQPPGLGRPRAAAVLALAAPALKDRREDPM
jgi:hypothetical protein